MEAFAKKNYSEAADQFTELLEKYPGDKVYMYYAGKSLVLQNKEPKRAAALLQSSVAGSSIVQNIPYDSWFFLGRAQQMAGDYTKAIESYETFSGYASRKEIKGLGIKTYLDECAASTGALAQTTEAVAVPATEVKAEPTAAEVVIAAPPAKISDSLNTVLDKRLAEVPQEKPAMTPVQQETKKVDESVVTYSPPTNAIVKTDTLKIEKQPEPAPVKAETVVPPVVKEVVKEPVVTTTRKPVFSLFEMMSVPADATKIAVNVAAPEGLVYRIQLAVFRNPVAASYFKGLFPVNGIKADGSDLTYYYAGQFRRYSDAEKALVTVKSSGFKDAFIVATVSNKTISLDRGKLLEGEWASKPLFEETVTSTVQSTDEPPVLVFRVEVARTAKPLQPDIQENLRKVTETKGMDILVSQRNESIYLVGKFLTFESAADYSDILVRNGYRDAKVVAYMGSREVPLETAKQLFEKR